MNSFPPTTRVAAYVRVSTDEQKLHGLSIEAQSAALQEWADKNGLKITEFYNDAGISARKAYSKRPALLRLLEDVKAKKIDLIVFTKLDRWFRQVGQYYKVQEVLDDHKVAWKTIHEDYDTTTAAGRLKVNIMLSVAQDEADRTSERIKKVFELKRAKGEPVSGHVPTGYKIVDKTIVKDPDTEPVVSTFFSRYLESGSIWDAIDHTEATHGTLIKYQLASSMLSKSAYWGDFNGIECPAYITKEQGEYIVSTRRRVSRKTQQNRVYLFTGLLTCAECGARLGGRTHPVGGVEKAEYNCPGHSRKKGCGNRTNIREAAIEEYIFATIDDRFEAYKSSCYNTSGVSIAARTQEITKLKRKLSKLKELYLNDLITLDEYRIDHNQYTAALTALQNAQKQTKRPQVEALSEILCDGWKDLYADMGRPEKKAFWRMLLSDIRIYSDRHIDYDFL